MLAATSARALAMGSFIAVVAAPAGNFANEEEEEEDEEEERETSVGGAESTL